MTTTSTFFALFAEFGTAEIELAKVAPRFFGLNEAEAKRRASLNRLPVPAHRLGGPKSPWLININHLAAHVDRCLRASEESHQRSKAA